MSRLRRALRNFKRRTPREKRVLVEAALLLPTVHLLQRTLPYRRWRELLEQNELPFARQATAPSVDEISRAVETARKYVPGEYKCLPAAYATHLLLHRHGHASLVHFGVSRDPMGKVEAHAWVDCDGRVVMGQLDDLERFVPFPLKSSVNK